MDGRKIKYNVSILLSVVSSFFLQEFDSKNTTLFTYCDENDGESLPVVIDFKTYSTLFTPFFSKRGRRLVVVRPVTILKDLKSTSSGTPFPYTE